MNRSYGSVSGAALVVGVAILLNYIGIVIAVSLVRANGDARALMGAGLYGMVSVAIPLALSILLIKRAGWTAVRAIRAMASLSILMNLGLAPLGLGIMSM
jgi:urea transporter